MLNAVQEVQASKVRHICTAASLFVVMAVVCVVLLHDVPQDEIRSSLTSIPYIRQETRDKIDSGQWNKEAVVTDQQAGLLPPNPPEPSDDSDDFNSAPLDVTSACSQRSPADLQGRPRGRKARGAAINSATSQRKETTSLVTAGRRPTLREGQHSVKVVVK
eukprot:762048-Hanusia_phi.AAC.4